MGVRGGRAPAARAGDDAVRLARGRSRVKPSVYLSPIAQTTSNSPATTSTTQAMAPPPVRADVARTADYRRVRRPGCGEMRG